MEGEERDCDRETREGFSNNIGGRQQGPKLML